MASIWKLASQTCRSNRASLFLPGSTPSVTQRRSMWAAHMPGKKFCFERLSATPLFSGCPQKRNITLLTTFKVVDNSILGKSVKKNRKPYLIGFYKGRKTAEQGDVIKVAIAGKTNKAVVIGTRKTKHHTIPRYDNNCIVLVDDNLAPLGTRIKAPIPTILRKRQDKLSKVLALATRFI